MVTVNNITVKTNNNTLLQDVSCTLTPGSITSFIGKSGTGKTTLLTTIAGLTKTTTGIITTNTKHIGYVFQDFNLFPHLTVLENCIDPLLVSGLTPHDAKERAIFVLKELDMQNFVNKYPNQLSGGQRQRVAIARALSLKTSVLLLDEPTASLDPINTEILVTLLQQLASQGFTIGLSSQDMSFVQKIFDRIYFIDTGKIIEFCDNKDNVPSSIKDFLK